MMAIKECFACESLYNSDEGADRDGFCSLGCREEFDLQVRSEIEIAKHDGLITDEGVALPQGNSLSEVQARSIIDQFKLKVQIK